MMLKYFKRGLALAAGAALLASCGGPATATSTNPKASAVTPSEVRSLREGIAPLVDRSPGSTEVIVHKSGLVEDRILRGHQQVVVARRNQDGTLQTSCVDNADSAVQAVTAPGQVRRMEAR
jgi:hypothetical protein